MILLFAKFVTSCPSTVRNAEYFLFILCLMLFGNILYFSEIPDEERFHHSTLHVAKTKALISCAVTAQLICAFVFA